MILRGIDFGPVHQASGAMNFHGKGWWHHKYLWPLGLDFRGATFVSKTSTLLPRAGNMPLKKDGLTPKEWFPRCIIVDFKKKAVLNAVSLSGPGLGVLLARRIWQCCDKPMFISLMSLAPTSAERLAELTTTFEMVRDYFEEAQLTVGYAPLWGLQVNFSCPNGGLDPNDLIAEVVPALERADKILPLQMPVMPKFGPEIHPESVVRISRAPRCDALHFCNTMPFGKHPKWAADVPPIDWKGLYGTDDPKESPMVKRFPGFAGGYSGPELLPFVIAWVSKVRELGVTIPICGGGGISCPEATGHVFDAGADAVSIASLGIYGPFSVRRTIRGAHEYARRHTRRVFRPAQFEYNV